MDEVKKCSITPSEQRGKRERKQIYVHELKKLKIKISIDPNMLKPNGTKVHTKYLLVWGGGRGVCK
jgi:hypothetical protein